MVHTLMYIKFTMTSMYIWMHIWMYPGASDGMYIPRIPGSGVPDPGTKKKKKKEKSCQNVAKNRECCESQKSMV